MTHQGPQPNRLDWGAMPSPAALLALLLEISDQSDLPPLLFFRLPMHVAAGPPGVRGVAACVPALEAPQTAGAAWSISGVHPAHWRAHHHHLHQRSPQPLCRQLLPARPCAWPSKALCRCSDIHHAVLPR